VRCKGQCPSSIVPRVSSTTCGPRAALPKAPGVKPPLCQISGNAVLNLILHRLFLALSAHSVLTPLPHPLDPLH
jgi:hypothetical protein